MHLCELCSPGIGEHGLDDSDVGTLWTSEHLWIQEDEFKLREAASEIAHVTTWSSPDVQDGVSGSTELSQEFHLLEEELALSPMQSDFLSRWTLPPGQPGCIKGKDACERELSGLRLILLGAVTSGSGKQNER